MRVLGLDPAVAGDQLRRRIGAQLQDAALPERMRVAEALSLFAALHPAPRPTSELVDEWQLGDILRRPFAALSGGERQRLFVALALVGRPELVFLDELTQNLDPMARRHTWDVVRHVRDAGTTVVLVTHDVEEAERLCDRIVVMDHGQVVADGTPAAIVDELGGSATVRFTDAEIDVRTLRTLPGVSAALPARTGGPRRGQRAAAGLRRRPPRRRRATRPRPARRAPSLEDRFVALTKGTPHEHRHCVPRPRRPLLAARSLALAHSHRRKERRMTTLIQLTRMELRLLRREPGVLVGLIGFPVVTVLVLAGVFGSTPDPDFGGVVPSEHYVVGYVGVVLASMGLITLPAMLAERRERGVLRRYTASGVSGGMLVAVPHRRSGRSSARSPASSSWWSAG